MKNLFLKSIKQVSTSALIFMALSIFLLTSCSKDEHPISTENLNHIYTIDVKRKVVNGVLTFETMEDLRKYHAELTRLTNESDDSDDVFKSFEIGYNSLRPIIEAKRLEFLGNSSNANKSSGDYTEVPGGFIVEEVRESMLNEYYEIGVGDSLYVYMSLNQIYRTTLECVTDAEVLRGIEKGNDETFSSEIFNTSAVLMPNPTHTLTRAIETTVLGCTGNGSGGNDNDNNTAICIDDNPIFGSTVESCEPFNRAFVMNTFHILKDCLTGEILGESPVVSVTYDIDFGDGTSTIISGLGEQTFDKAYSTSGDLPLTAVVTSVDIDGFVHVFTISQTINIDSSAACADENATKWTGFFDDTNNRAMNCKIYYLDDFWGTHAGAKTIGLKRNDDDTEWVKEKGYIWVEIDLDWMNNDCTFNKAADESDDCDNCKEERAQKTRSKKRSITADGSMFSRHRFDDNNASFDETIFLEICP